MYQHSSLQKFVYFLKHIAYIEKQLYWNNDNVRMYNKKWAWLIDLLI